MERQEKPSVKVCVHTTCCMRGSEKIYEELKKNLSDEALVEKTNDCTRFCKSGPNIAVNGMILHGVRSGDAVSRVRREIKHPSRKIDGVGSKSLDELDSVLDDLFL